MKEPGKTEVSVNQFLNDIKKIMEKPLPIPQCLVATDKAFEHLIQNCRKVNGEELSMFVKGMPIYIDNGFCLVVGGNILMMDKAIYEEYLAKIDRMKKGGRKNDDTRVN